MLADMSADVDQKGLAAILTSIQSAGIAPEVNLRITQMRKHTKGIHSGFETEDRCHQKSKTGVSVTPQKGTYVLQNFKKKKKKKNERQTAKQIFAFARSERALNCILIPEALIDMLRPVHSEQK